MFLTLGGWLKLNKMKSSKIIIITYILIIVVLLIGEVKCIYKAVTCNWEPVGKSEVIYTASACTGLGIVVGWIDIEDK